jgi:hypothetical protein
MLTVKFASEFTLITPESVFSSNTELGAESGRWVNFGNLKAIRDPPSFRPARQAFVDKLDISISDGQGISH